MCVVNAHPEIPSRELITVEINGRDVTEFVNEVVLIEATEFGPVVVDRAVKRATADA